MLAETHNVDLDTPLQDETDRSHRKKRRLQIENETSYAVYSKNQKTVALTLAIAMTLALVANAGRTVTNTEDLKVAETLLARVTPSQRVMEEKPCDMRLKSLSTAIVADPTGSGKTELLKKLIKKAQHNISVKIIYCYGVNQSAFGEITSLVTFHEGMIEVVADVPNDGQHRWIILDDLMGEEGNSSETTALYTKHSHHRNINVSFVLLYFFLFKNPRYATIVTNLGRQMYPGNALFLTKVFEDATQKPYSLMIDLKQNTPDICGLVSGFPDADMIVYEQIKNKNKRKR